MVPDAVPHDDHVAVAKLVVLVDEVLLVGLEALLGELLRLEERGQLAGLVRLGERALGEERSLYLLVGERLVAYQYYLAHLHLVLLVYVDVEYHLVLGRHVIALLDVYHRVLVPFLVEVLPCQRLGAVDDVRRYLAPGHDPEPRLEVFALAFLQPVVVYRAHAGPEGEVEAEVYLGAHYRVGRDRHLREQPVPPVTLHGLGDLAARHAYRLPHGEAGDAGQHVVLIAFHALYRHAANLASARRAGV